jgi:hypothetical protein
MLIGLADLFGWVLLNITEVGFDAWMDRLTAHLLL